MKKDVQSGKKDPDSRRLQVQSERNLTENLKRSWNSRFQVVFPVIVRNNPVLYRKKIRILEVVVQSSHKRAWRTDNRSGDR